MQGITIPAQGAETGGDDESGDGERESLLSIRAPEPEMHWKICTGRAREKRTGFLESRGRKRSGHVIE
jgi:hypothetical protein